MKKEIKEAVYVAFAGGLFYFAAKRLNVDAYAALLVGTAVGKIVAQDIDLTELV